METRTATVWLTYDLGVGGDFQGLYSWLDDNEAIECGNNCAYIRNYKFPNYVIRDNDFAEFLKKDLEGKVKFNSGSRVYIVRSSIEIDKGRRSIGSFVIGKRKASPWEGFGTKTENTVDE